MDECWIFSLFKGWNHNKDGFVGFLLYMDFTDALRTEKSGF